MTNSEAAAMLRKFGIQPSQPRVAIYAYLDSLRNHPTADTIYAALSPDYPSLSRTTVYNTLKLFRSCGAAQGIIIEDGEMRFDADISKHAHFKCADCGEVHDLFFDPAQYLPPVPMDFFIQEIHVNYRGVCPDCCKKRNRKSS